MVRLFFRATAPVLLLAALAFHQPGLARVLAVNPDGSTPNTTIGGAILAASAGDTVTVAAGNYHETIWIQKSLTLLSASGERDVTLDGEGRFRIMLIEYDVEVNLAGLDFVDGVDQDAAALLIWKGARARVDHCAFRQCHATLSNAVHVRHPDTRATFSDCLFQDNTAGLHSAALSSSHEARLTVTGCVFAGNSSQGSSGAVNCTSGLAVFENNLFKENQGLLSGALAFDGTAHGRVAGNTFHANRAPGYAAVRLNDQVEFTGNIVSGSKDSFGLESQTPANRRENIFFGNDSGDLLGSGPAADEVLADPLFCDPPRGTFTLCGDSPALARNNGTRQIGAFPEGCPPCSHRGGGPAGPGVPSSPGH